MAEAEEVGGAELLASPIRRRIMDLLVAHARAVRDPDLAAEPPGVQSDDQPCGMTAAELADEVQLHVTTVRFHLDQMLAAGLLVSHSVRGPGAGRPRKVYEVSSGTLLNEGALDERTAYAFEVLAKLLARAWVTPDGVLLSPEDAGFEWSMQNVGDADRADAPAETPGQWLDRIGRVVDLLAEWGYTGEVATTHGGRRATIRLVDCPFLDLARERPDVVCGVHRGLLAGALQACGEPDPEVSLEPFVTPRECLAHLTRPPFQSTPTRQPANGSATRGSYDQH